MSPPLEGLVRVFPRVHAEGLRPGQWADVPAGVAQRLLSMAFVTLTDDAGDGPPEELRRVGCCG